MLVYRNVSGEGVSSPLRLSSPTIPDPLRLVQARPEWSRILSRDCFCDIRCPRLIHRHVNLADIQRGSRTSFEK